MKSGTGTQRRSSLFLIELMISIFFFAIASSVCIQLFARAKQISDESSAKNQALLQAESADLRLLCRRRHPAPDPGGISGSGLHVRFLFRNRGF